MSTEKGTRKFDNEDVGDFQVQAEISEVDDRISRLRSAIKQAGGNQVVASRSSVPLSTLNGYLAGRDLKATSLVALSRACGVNVDWLATGEGPMSGLPPSAPIASEKPQNSAPRTAFSSINVDRMAAALQAAQTMFADAGGKPTMRELVQVMLLTYDTLSKESS